MKFLFFTFLFFVSAPVLGSSWSYPLIDSISYLEDKTHQRVYSDVVRSEFEFRAIKKGIPNLGYSASDFWFRIYLPTEVPKDENLFLEFRYPLEHIEVYFARADGTTDKIVTGEKGPFSLRPFKYRNQILNFPPGVRSPIYLKVSTPTSIQLPMTLWTGQALTEKINQEQFYLGIYFGIILISLLFHFVMTIFLKDLASLLYGMFLLSYGILQLTINRLSPQFLWPDSDWFNMNVIPVCLGTTMLFITAFAKVFLRTWQKPVINYVLVVSGTLSFLFGLTIFFIPYRTSIQLCFVGVILSSVSTVLAAAFRLSLGRPAILFLLSWSPFHVGLWALVAKSLGILPANFITNYGVQMASVFGILLFSISLADRFNFLRVEKENAERETEKMKQLSERNTRLAVQAQQVVHDIRSPLAALEVATTTSQWEIPESERRLLQGAISRIKDIINQLSQKYRKEESHSLESENPSAQILPSVIEPLISEKRLQFKNLPNLYLGLNFPISSYGLLSRVVPSELKRAVSNLIDNAVESLPDKKGNVQISFSQKDNFNQIIISDNGPGIPGEILPKLMSRGATFGKQGGSGLGLYHAKETVEKWGGNLTLKSSATKGTQAIISLPKDKNPGWYLPRLNLTDQTVVAVIDDDPSIYSLWHSRLEPYCELKKLKYFNHPDEFLNWYGDGSKPEELVVLCDNEFHGHYLGTELLLKVKESHQTVLVTGSGDNPELQQLSELEGFAVLPKALVPYLPIEKGPSAKTRPFPKVIN